jgi:hypothetical protein
MATVNQILKVAMRDLDAAINYLEHDDTEHAKIFVESARSMLHDRWDSHKSYSKQRRQRHAKTNQT